MERVLVAAIAIILVLTCPSAILAQGFGGLGGILPSGFFSTIPGLGACDLGYVRIIPRVDVGYQKIALNLNVPVAPTLTVGPVDLSVRDASVWVGSVGFDAQIGPRFSLYLNGQANAKRNVTVVEAESPSILVSSLSLALPLQRPGTGLQWWAIDGGAAWRLRRNVSLLGGYRQDQLSLNLGGLRTADGQSLDLDLAIDSIFSLLTRFRGDLKTQLYIPYFGVEFSGVNYRSSLIFSPFVWAKANVPLRGNIAISVPIVSLEIDLLTEWRFSLSKPGVFLEGKFEYDIDTNRGGLLRLWVTGNWLRVRGGANENFTLNAQGFIGPFQFLDATVTDTGSATSTLTRYLLAGGVSAVIPF